MKNMNSLKFEIEAESFDDKTNDLVNELKTNNILLRCLKANHIDESVIENNAWMLKEWLDEVKVCEACLSLESCKQKNKGYYPNLKNDELLNVVYQPCKKAREYNEKTKHLDNYLLNDLPKHMESISFSDIELVGEDRAYGEAYNKCVDASNDNKGLYIYGTMGSGKTYLAICAANEHARNGEKVAFIHYPSFCLKMANNAFSDESEDIINSAMRANFLVIDDIGAESVTEYNRDQILLPLLNHRYENNKCTWFTSNVDLDNLLKHFTTSSKGLEDEMKALRILERITHMAESILLATKDRRI